MFRESLQTQRCFRNLIFNSMLQPKNIKADMKRCRTTMMSGAEIRLAYAQQSCCSKDCMQKLIQGSHASKSSRRSVRGSNSSSNSSVLSVDTDTTFDGLDSSLFCQQIGMPTSSIPYLEFDKFIEEVRRPLFALTAGTTSTEEANDQLRYYLVQKFTENRIGDPDNKQNFLYLYQLHSLSRGVITVCKTTYIVITGISLSAIDYAQRLVRKNTSAESIILKGDERSLKQESLKEAFASFGMNFNLYQQNINQFVDIMKIPDTPTACICVAFLAEWFELAGEQEVCKSFVTIYYTRLNINFVPLLN